MPEPSPPSAYDTPEAAARWAAGLSAFERGLLETVPPGARVLDLGSASGRADAFLRERGCQVLSADLAHAMAKASGGIQARAEALPFRSASFDAVILLKVLHLLPTKARLQAHAEVLRVLKPGGFLVTTVLCPTPAPPLGGAYGPIVLRKFLRGAFLGVVLTSNILVDLFRSTGLFSLKAGDRLNPGGERPFFHHFSPGGITDEFLTAGWGALSVRIVPPLEDGWRRRLPFPGLESRSLGVLARAPL